MPIFDYNNSAATQIGKVYDHNGTTTTQIGKVYDHNGTTLSLIFSSETDAFTDLGGFGTASVGYQHNGWPSAGPPITFGESSSFPNSYFGSIIWSNNKVDVSNGGAVSLTLTTPLTMENVDTNLAHGATYHGALSVVFSSSRTSISGVITVQDTIKNAAAAVYDTVNLWKTWYGSSAPTTSTAAAGTYTSTIGISGSYYLGIFLNGYDARVTAKPSISQIIIT